MATIRELFHNLGNKHNVISVGSGATKDIVRDWLKEESLSGTLKDDLSEILKNLEQLEKGAIEADRIATEIHDRIYQVIDPDTGKPKL